MVYVSVVNRSKSSVVGTQVAVADSFFTRLLGLLGKRSLAPGQGLLIAPSSGVHTFWMRMCIDVVALDRRNRVVKLGHNVKPWRLSGISARVSSVLELAAGEIVATGIEVGDALEMRPHEQS